MNQDKCNEYIQNIKELKNKDLKKRHLNDVFDVDLVFINSIFYMLFFSLIVILLFLVYIFVISSFIICCCNQLKCLIAICKPCFTCFIYIFGFSYIFLFFALNKKFCRFLRLLQCEYILFNNMIF